MNERQRRFVQEYLIDLNASAAARRAGYAAKNADVTGARLLGNASIQAAIKEANGQRAHKVGITAERVLEEFAAVAFSDLGQLIEFGGDGFRFRDAATIPEAARKAVSSIKVRREEGGENRPAAQVVEFRLWPKVEALTKLAQHLGLLKEQHEVSGPNGTAIPIVGIRIVPPAGAAGEAPAVDGAAGP